MFDLEELRVCSVIIREPLSKWNRWHSVGDSRRLGRGTKLGRMLSSTIHCNSHCHTHKHLRYGDAQSCGDEGLASSEQLQSEAIPEFYTANYSHISSIFKIPSKGKVAQVSQEYTFDVPMSIEKLNIHTSVSWKLTWQRS